MPLLERLVFAPDVFARRFRMRSEVVTDDPVVGQQRTLRRKEVHVDRRPMNRTASQVVTARHTALAVMAVAARFERGDSARPV